MVEKLEPDRRGFKRLLMLPERGEKIEAMLRGPSRLVRVVVLQRDLRKGLVRRGGLALRVRRVALRADGFCQPEIGELLRARFLASSNEKPRVELKPLAARRCLKAREPPRVMCGRHVNVERLIG